MTNAGPQSAKPSQNATAVSASQAVQIVELANKALLFHTGDGRAFASIPHEDHNENISIRGKEFGSWLRGQYYSAFRDVPGERAMRDAIATLEGKAQFEGPEQEVFHRIAELNGAIYIDLVNNSWEAVEVTANGWRILRDPPVKFRRFTGMRTLPVPTSGGNINALKRYVNFESEADFVLVVAWLLGAFSPSGPYPILVLTGPQGSAKSTTARVVRSLIDPNDASVRAEPREFRDLMVTAKCSWVVSFDNLSGIRAWLADGICGLATGRGLGKRQLFTDEDEIIFNAQRPIILNGIEELSSRGDLLDRAVLITLPSIPEHKRQSEKQFWKSFDADKPDILGALLDALVEALRNLPHVVLPELPRLADFAMFVTAAGPAFGWQPETFISAYRSNRAGAHEVVLDGNPIAALLQKMTLKSGLSGTATELLRELHRNADPLLKQDPNWPKGPKALANALRRLDPSLRSIGITTTFIRSTRRTRDRIITINRQAVTSSLQPVTRTEVGTRTNADDVAGTVNMKVGVQSAGANGANGTDDEIVVPIDQRDMTEESEFMEETI